MSKRATSAERDAPAAKRVVPDHATDAAAPKTCDHFVACPRVYEPSAADAASLYDPKVTGTYAKTWPFTLDPFQEKACAVLERKESIMVAAHTSAGKTVVAEYAVAMAFRDDQRAVYTSPLKALSNQKYRELSDEFKDVGLMTGDVTLNPNAACIIMTTEVLRSMLYRGSETVREVGWVIFDEVHYMRDRERGVVWEESIVLIASLLPGASMVFLSATLSNAHEFAEWVANLTARPCHVVSTDHRPTPLRHYAFPQGGSGVHLVCDGKSFKADNYAKATAALEDAKKAPAGSAEQGGVSGRKGPAVRGGRGGKGDEANDVYKLVRMCKDKKFFPVIVFSFSRRETEANCSMCSKLAFNNEEEAAQVQAIFDAAIDNLPDSDRNLPAIQGMLPMLLKGVAVHHSGLLPILKELVEILFQEHLIKALFATETFAMGLNMPAKAVVFTQVSKWDGESHRVMTAGEYTQMSGRAGRRGMDEFGLAIVMIDGSMDATQCEEMMLGKASPLLSTFHLTYYTLLNLMQRSEGTLDMQFVIEKSFLQYQHTKKIPELDADIVRLEKEAAQIVVPSDASATEYQRLRTEVAKAEGEIMSVMIQPQRSLHFLRTGRLVRVQQSEVDWGWAVVLKAYRVAPTPATTVDRLGEAEAADMYRVDTLVCALPQSKGMDGGRLYSPVVLEPNGKLPEGVEPVVMPVALTSLVAISVCRVSVPKDLRPHENRLSVLLAIQELIGRFPQGLPKLDPVEDMGIVDDAFGKRLGELRQLELELTRNPHHNEASGDASTSKTQMLAFERKAQLLAQVAEKRAQKVSGSLVRQFRDELKNRSMVLKKLGHISEDGAQVLLKGRAMCEIDTADELLVTELMFHNAFAALSVPQLVALMSCFMQVEKSEDQIHLKDTLAKPLALLQETARTIGTLQLENKIQLDVDEYVDGFKPTLMDIVYKWVNGISFAEISQSTDLFEGSIIRAMRRLSELVAQLAVAATVVGNTELAEKATKGVEGLQRGIVFAASLYLSE